MGGRFTPPAIRRAAKYGDGYIGMDISSSLYNNYVTELRNVGKPTTDVRLAGGRLWLIAATDPEKTWHEGADHVLYQMNAYAEWGARAGMPLFPPIRDTAHLRELEFFKVVDVDTCIQLIRDSLAQAPLTHFYSWTLPPGLPAQWIQPHLELFANKAIPAFR